MQVSICYTEPGNQAWLKIEVPEGTTAAGAINASGILKMFPSIDLASQKIGVFGKVVPTSAKLRPGDRIEIYRAIVCDPKAVPRRATETDDEDQEAGQAA